MDVKKKSLQKCSFCYYYRRSKQLMPQNESDCEMFKIHYAFHSHNYNHIYSKDKSVG